MSGQMILAVENALHTLETVEHLLVDVCYISSKVFYSLKVVNLSRLYRYTSLWLVDVYFSVERMSNYVIVAGNCH